MEQSNTTGTLNLTTMETLQSLNDKLSRLDMGPLIFVGAMMVIGFFGNLHVLIFYSLRMKSTNHRDFIVFLSLLDLTICIIGMPLSIYTLKDPLFHATRATCKLHVFVNYFICIASGFMLLIIAFERYRIICKPFGWQLPRKCAKVACVLVLTAALVCALPVLILTETDRLQLKKYPWINAKICVDVDQNTAYQYNISLAIIVMLLLIALIVLYTLIWKVTRGCSLPKMQTTLSIESHSDSVTSTSFINLRTPTLTSTTADSVKNKVRVTKMSSSSRRQLSKSRKLTLAFSCITAVFFISFIPYVVLYIVFSPFDVIPDSESKFIAVRIFVYFSAYASSTTNCFIYGFTNSKFRHEVKIAYMKLFCCK